jgi:uncharacterized lipoprotein YehR (DUF1307 family)
MWDFKRENQMKNHRKIKNIFFALMLSTAVTGCKDVLDTQPFDKIADRLRMLGR